MVHEEVISFYIVATRIILENDANSIVQRASLKGLEIELPLAEQTLSQAFHSAKEQLTRSLLR